MKDQATATVRTSCANNSEIYVVPKTSDCGNCTTNTSCLCDKDVCPPPGNVFAGIHYNSPQDLVPFMGVEDSRVPEFYAFAQNIIDVACSDKVVTDRNNLLLNSAYGRLSKKLYDNVKNLTIIAESFLNISQVGMPNGTHGIYMVAYPLPTCPNCPFSEFC